MHADLLTTARNLLCPTEGTPPSPTDLRRAVSTAYYALFHHISSNCSELLGSADTKSLGRAKMQIYRSIGHRDVIAACQMARRPGLDFPKPVADYAALFINMYKSRSNADYDPSANGDFVVPQVLHKIGEAEEAIRRFDTVERDDRRAFAILIVAKKARAETG